MAAEADVTQVSDIITAEHEDAAKVDGACLAWLRGKLQLACPAEGTGPDTQREWLQAAWDDATHLPHVATFFTGLKSNRMFAVVWRPQDAGFSLTTEAPKAFHRIVYFVKDGTHFITRDNINTCVQFGVLRATAAIALPGAAPAGAAGAGGASEGEPAPARAAPGPLAALLQLLGGVYLPQLAAPNSGWPESARRDFLSTTHRFMAALTEAVHDAAGRTVLYVPRGEALAGRPVAEAARDRVLTQRLETTVIHWTRQVRAVLHKAEQLDASTGPLGPAAGSRGCGAADGGAADGGAADGGAAAASSGPLAEIAFWRQRAEDLGGLNAQLASKGVCDVVAVLAACGSGYLADFEAQRGAIARDAEAARDNVKFLACLEGPCGELAAAPPAAVPALLPRVLNCVRIVWSLSAHYNTPERLVGLLRRIAGEVVARCAAAVRAHNPLSARGEPGVRAAVAALAECIAACEALKSCYARTAAAVSRALPARSWDGIDVTPVFPVVEAFLQRCRDLSDVCEAQLQFVPATAAASASNASHSDQGAGGGAAALGGSGGDGDKDAAAAAAGAAAAAAAVGRGLVLPVFGGARGAEMEKSIADIAAAFQGYLSGLRRLDYDILDAKALRWHDDFAAFKAGVRDMEVMLENVMAAALDAAPGLPAVLELLEAYARLAVRPALRRALRRAAAAFYGRWGAELNAVKKQLEALRRAPPRSPALPRYASAAQGATTLLRRLQQTHTAFTAVRHLLLDAPEADDVLTSYELTHQSVQQFVVNTHTEWFATIDPGLSKMLQAPLLLQDKADRGLLSVNFARELLSMSAEVVQWERLRMAVPYVAMEIQAQRDKYRALREHALALAHDYNRVVSGLDARERVLFHDRLRALDRRVTPGLSKLTWRSDRPTLEFYFREARKHCRLTEAVVTEFKAGVATIEGLCRGVAEGLLVDVERKRLYELPEFEAVQAEHHARAKALLIDAHAGIDAALKEMHAAFEPDGEEVQREWVRFTQRVDKKLEDALRATVKRSLQALSRMLNGDSKTEVLPLFRVTMVLERNARVELRPTVQQLFDTVHKVSRDLITVLQFVPRVSRPPTERQRREAEERGEAIKPPPSFYDVVSADEDATVRAIVTITTGITGVSEPVQASLEHFEKRYRKLWDQDKDAYIRRYEKAQKPLSSYEADINEFLNKQDEVAHEETTTNVKFLFIDCGPLKQALSSHCDLWQSKLTGLLNRQAAAELKALHDAFRGGLEALAAAPADLAALAEAVSLHGKLAEDRGRIEARFEPLRDKYRVLEKFEVQIPDAQVALLDSLDAEWGRFQVGLEEAGGRLEKAKDAFREQVKALLEGFLRDIAAQSEEFARLQPLAPEGLQAAGGTGYSTKQALAFLARWRGNLSAGRARAAEIKSGLDIFGLPAPAYQELAAMDKALDALGRMWGTVEEWEGTYAGWKGTKFRDIKVDDLEEVAGRINKALAKLGKECKAWPVWGWLKDCIEAFKRTLPLITDLRSPGMRPRHWQQLRDHIGRDFEPASAAFTLDSVVTLRLDTAAEFISELAGNAAKEASIEAGLASIATTWSALELDMAEYKGTWKLRSAEEVFAALEDNSVALSSMKASKYFLVFEKEVTRWEGTLAALSEAVEVILQVQRSWMYLESIFGGSEDIRKQLPSETTLFEGVDASFTRAMRELKAAGNVVAATTRKGLLAAFQGMDASLERIQRSLDAYLESKRVVFPRFYFLSSDDLLEILGQARDPQNVQAHLKKCFEGIKRLDMLPPGSDGRKVHESVGITSPDGEYLPLVASVVTEGRPEEWLGRVEAAMFAATKRALVRGLEDSKGTKKEKWVRAHPGQVVLTAGQILWTAECERALADTEQGPRRALKALRKRWLAYLNELTGMTRSKLEPVDRSKVVSLITVEVHARDVIDKLVKANASSPSDFEWASQLRFYWDRDTNDAVVKQVLSVFTYGYEYQGNNGRLVITPLTDRCYMTLGAAMFTRRGGNPLGPAGTGKTETVKDFGKALARYVIVFNCSDGVDYKMTGKMFSGLAQTGAWACLDEFNRIEVEVLSVVASQIAAVMQAVKEERKMFNFLGQDIRLIPTCGIFVTMNPGYAGRSELPDNLKALLRPVSMMVPDFVLIAEIMMFSEGFSAAKVLARKMAAIMELSQQQLSKQDHYDYGLRSFVIPIARAAGVLKRADPEASEEVILYRTMLGLIQPKLVYLDLPLFMALLSDLFPGVETPPAEGGPLKAALEAELREANLQVVPAFVSKIVQIFDCKVARHGNMIVGRTGAGKSEAWRCLARAMARLRKEGSEDPRFQKVHVHTINPLALSVDELYGSFDAATHEWRDGVLARIMRNACRDESDDQKWILFDGPVDTLWIESMNSTLDDNKLLTLLSGERIAMPAQVSLLFEVEDLSQASPATVSRAGMIYMNTEDLGWRPIITSWLERRVAAAAIAAGSSYGATSAAGAAAAASGGGAAPAAAAVREARELSALVLKLVERYMEAALEFKRLNCRDLVPVDRLSSVRTFTRLFDALATPDNGVVREEGPESWAAMVEMWFLFSLIWGLGGTLDQDGRKRFDSFMREMDTRYPSGETVFEYSVDARNKGWLAWEARLPQGGFKPPADVPAYRLLVPTLDTQRNKFVVGALVRCGHHAMVVGGVGVGKTMTLQSLLEALPADRAHCTINFSAQTSSGSLQDSIESRLEKRTKGVFGAVGGKRLVAFIDDLNMPAKSKFGFMPPLELLKLWADNGFWYDRQRCEVKAIKDMQLLAAMAPPGGGRSAFSQRVMAVFSSVNMTQPNDAQLRRIFSAILHTKLAEFNDEVRPLGEPLVAASVELYRCVVRDMLPTPSKSHYLFNTRDLGKLVMGIMQASKAFTDNKDELLQLWCHEAERMLGDRMWDAADRAWLRRQMDERLGASFGTSTATLFEATGGEVLPYVSFLRAGTVETPPYEPVRDMAALKALLQDKMEEAALEPGARTAALSLFKDALLHVCRIHRILSQPRGNALLVGVGGSGRKSLARLAAYVAEMKVVSIEITRNYRQTEWREDLKALYRTAGVAGKRTAFLLDETQIKYETFLEDVNNIVTSGEVPNVFPKDELGAVLDELRPAAKAAGAGETQDALVAFLLERVRANLHVVLCLSPVGEAFRERCRMFPGLVNCTTIDWFLEWPADALYEVAARRLSEDTALPAIVGPAAAEAVRAAACRVLVGVHQSVEDTARRMWAALRRRVYVTPTNYLECVHNYAALLGEKRAKLAGKAGKLQGGLLKLDETRTQVSEMQVVATAKAQVVAQAKADCEELLVAIVQDKRAADEQEKAVNAEATKIGREAEEANAIAQQVSTELERALPALREAEEALNVLTKKDISELKAYSKPPALVELTLGGVMTVLKRPATWEETKKQLGDANFMMKLLQFDKDTLDDALLKKINKFTAAPDFTPDAVGKVSLAAKGMCMWVRAMEVYGRVAKEVGPKRARLKAAQENLAKKQAALAAAQEQLAAVLAKVASLRQRYEESMSNKATLEAELADLAGKLARAEKLVAGLAGERHQWQASIGALEARVAALPGDVAVAAAFLSYAGPFPSEYRDELARATWLPQVRALALPASESFDFCSFLADPATVRDWNIWGLPADAFSTENGVMVARGRRWPLMIDPQGQAVRWVRNMEAGNGVKVVSITAPDMMRQVEAAVQFGRPVLLVDVMEELDPALEPLLGKSYIKRGSQVLVKLGDKEVDVSPDFRLYITTGLPNPTYPPEVTTRVALINFAVKQQGLEGQLLAAVVRHERPDLDQQKNELVVKVAAGKRTQADLEDKILALLSSASGSLLDNVALIDTLGASKATWEEVNASLAVAERTSRELEAAAAAYRPCSVRAAALYFVLNDLASVDPMYQFSLDSYTQLFALSLKSSPKPEALADRIKALNDHHTYAVYRYASRGLFERHKLLLSLQMCVRVLALAGQVNAEEWQFFPRGGQVLDPSSQPPNPAPTWISEEAWGNTCALDALPAFKGLASSFETATSAWEAWFRSAEPETAELPREWESRLGEMQRMLLARCLRPDRVLFAATGFVANALGRSFVEPPVLNLAETFADSSPAAPLIFVLSPGVDPTEALRKLAAEKGMAGRFFSVALGQGQAPIAQRLIEEGVKAGNWVFLANCHLMTSWLPTLAKIVEGLEAGAGAAAPHERFRLWLSSSPREAFPITILQRGIKMTTEPPKGLRANLMRMYQSVTDDGFRACKATAKYQKLLFALAFFHSVLLERRKFRTLGLNIPYDFNDTDFFVSDDLLRSYVDSYASTPWEALKYLIAEANYGGRVTDELDRRVLVSYMDKYYCEEALDTTNFKLSPLPTYFIPEPGSLQGYRDYIATLPVTDRPEAFGQHLNAEISYLIEDSRALLDGLAAAEPKAGGAAAGAGGQRREDAVAAIAADLLDQIPGPFNLEELMRSKADDPSALHVVLFQEAERYNALLARVRRSCAELQQGLKGLVVMSAELDGVANALYASRVPGAWLKTYPSLKPLGPWARDLLARVEQLAKWAEGGYPRVYWLGGFTYPTGFLTAVLQTAARRAGVPIDNLAFEHSVVSLTERDIPGPPKEGVYVKGLFLEGAGWDYEAGCLREPSPMELIVPMPVLHFKPVEGKKRGGRGVYSCPLYMYPVRTGTRERPSYMTSVELKAGAADPDHWVMRGAALLLALAS